MITLIIAEAKLWCYKYNKWNWGSHLTFDIKFGYPAVLLRGGHFGLPIIHHWPLSFSLSTM